MSSPRSGLVRRLRKGTFSCLECKRRKRRCDAIQGSSLGSPCVSCQRRGLDCISQGSITPDHRYESMGRQIDHVETLVHVLLQQHGPRQSESEPEPDDPTQGALTHREPRWLTYPTLPSQDSLNIYLHSLLPCPTIVVAILASSHFFKSPLQIEQRQPREQTSDLSPTAHPVIFAKRLVELALCLQQLNPSSISSEQLSLQLHGSISDVARRFLSLASNHVLSQDCLVASQDGIEALMLQVKYHITIGEIQTAWIIHRRMSKVASLIGLPQLAETTGSQAELVWFRIIYTDRFLSLMLGLPIEIADNHFANANRLECDEPAQRLERIHVLVAGHIIARNVRMQRSKVWLEDMLFSGEDYRDTKRIDHQLKEATRILPTTWWLATPIDPFATESEVSEHTANLLVQIHQYYLVVLLHEPFLLRSIHKKFDATVDYTYSKFAAVSASREVVSRFFLLRRYHRSRSYRALDEKCFMSSISLLFAHIDGHRLGDANVLEHQRSYDLGIVEQAIDLIEELSTSEREQQGISHVKILRRLLQMESDAADGGVYQVWNDGNTIGKHREPQDGKSTLTLSVPYFGAIHIFKQQQQHDLQF